MTLDQALADIERLKQEYDALYYAKGEDGLMRDLLPCEHVFIREYTRISREFADHIDRAIYLHHRGDDYEMVREVALKTQAVKLQRAFDTMKELREDERA